MDYCKQASKQTRQANNEQTWQMDLRPLTQKRLANSNALVSEREEEINALVSERED